ncbi:hypothetical protein F5144DRAFT_606607 [Chaetomium tenue]|uniref:Uncharacterized protein n=1 Tax=Chaetomium tenue TaxID=1854479 RepID=A0ACB7NUQ0_9PEZI|nr:hypothetical protein F5144DRAFT_606607 [Chaetomium globosum]
MSSITTTNLPPSDSQAGTLLADVRRELDDLCARADRAIHDAWVQHRDVRALLATPSHLQRQWWGRSNARFGKAVSKAVKEFNVGLWRLYDDTARGHGDELAEQVWETLRADDYAPANYQKVDGGTTHGLWETLAALEGVRLPVDGGGGGGGGGG